MTAGGSFIHKTTTEQRKNLDHFLAKYASFIIEPKPLQKKGMLRFEEPSSAESKPIPSLDPTVEPSPEPEIPKKGVIHPLEFLIEFDDYGRTSNLPWHEENTFLSKEVSPNVEPSKEWLKEVKHSFEAIQILSPSMSMTCSLKGTSMEALHNLTVRTNIVSQFLAETLLGNMLLVLTDKLFKSPSGLIFKCCGIARAMPIIINDTEVHLDFHIYVILEFDILIGYPLEKLFQEKPFLGSHDEKLGKTASAIPILCPKSPMAKHNPNHDPFEEAKFIFPFVSPRIHSKIERSSPSLEPKSCPSGQPNIVFNSD
jgi:hypothetical protein